MKQTQTTPQRRRRSGFTLLELLIVLGIILAIAAMVVPNLMREGEEARINVTKASIESFEEITTLYAAAHVTGYPQGGSEEVYQLLMSPETKNGRVSQPYLEEIPKDAWGQPLYYDYGNGKYPNNMKPAIWSSGPDMKNDDGGNDDITNWSHLTNAGS